MAVWSGASTNFALYVSTCRSHVTLEGSAPLVVTTTQLVTTILSSTMVSTLTMTQIDRSSIVFAIAIGVIAGLIGGHVAITKRRKKAKLPEHTRVY